MMTPPGVPLASLDALPGHLTGWLLPAPPFSWTPRKRLVRDTNHPNLQGLPSGEREAT